MGGRSSTGKYKSWKEIPLWLKFAVVGPFVLVLGGMLTHLFSLEAKEFDAQLEQKIQRINSQIAEGKFREIFLEGDRELIATNDENEFAGKLAKGQSQLRGKYQKMNGGSLRYDDVFNRLKRFFGRPALACNFYQIKSDTQAGNEYFCWILRGDEIRLIYYDFQELDRKRYN
ncbi:MAG TPA: hypothetical protein VIL74_16790 [Pyrinomonadaceae bacterium]|jgi:hypothetical protein